MVKELLKPISTKLPKLIMNSFNPMWEGTLQIIDKENRIAYTFVDSNLFK